MPCSSSSVSGIGLTTRLPSLAMNWKGTALPVGPAMANLKKRDMQALQDAEAILSRQHLHERRVAEVDQRHVADHAVGGEDVEEVLAVLIERRIRHDQVDVEIEVAVVQAACRWVGAGWCGSGLERLVATILGAVIVDHHEHAFVDILGREEEPVVVGPHGSLVLTVVAGHRRDAAVAIGAARGRDRGIGIDLVAPGERGAPAVVVEGAGEVVHVGGAIAFRTVVGVVEVQLVLIAPKAAVLGAIDRQISCRCG